MYVATEVVKGITANAPIRECLYILRACVGWPKKPINQRKLQGIFNLKNLLILL